MQIEASTRRAAPGHQAPSLYLMTWVAVAAFGLGYIGVATTRPDLLGTIFPLADQQQDQANAGRQPGDLAEEMVVLRKWVHELQHELAATRSGLHEQAAQNNAVLLRLSAAEERIGALRDVRDPAGRIPAAKLQTRAQAPAQPPLLASAEPSQRTAQASTWTADVAAATAPARSVPPAAPITTGSVPEAVAATAGAPAAKAAPVPVSPRAIEIGTAESLDGLRAKWGEIASRHGDVLGDAAPRYRLSADGRTAPFTLLAGPFETPADATRACTVLRAKGVACRVGGSFTGNQF